MAVQWPPNNGPPICAQQWAANMAAPWLPTSRLGGRPLSGGHSASTWPHVLRPPPTTWPTRLGHHPRPAGRPRSASTWLHVRPPSPSIVAPRLGPPPSTMAGPVRPTLAVRGFHLPSPSTSIARLGGRPNFGSPLEPHWLSGRPPHAYWATNSDHVSAPHCGRPLGAPPRHRPPIPFPLTQAGTKTECIGAPPARARPRIWVATKNPHPVRGEGCMVGCG